ncbi:hypothetical protein Ddc_11499 [Ditylenchus destructor]|nr:hypothetical protein Ddc_11499 [Ditylenchus destructor]
MVSSPSAPLPVRIRRHLARFLHFLLHRSQRCERWFVEVMICSAEPMAEAGPRLCRKCTPLAPWRQILITQLKRGDKCRRHAVSLRSLPSRFFPNGGRRGTDFVVQIGI